MSDLTRRWFDASHWPRVKALVWPFRRRVTVLALSSFLTGGLEALFLVVVTRTALAIADGESAVTLVGDAAFSRGVVVATAAGLLAGRVLVSLWGVRLSVGLWVSISNRLRQRLATAYLHATWAVQQGEQAGRLQQLVTSFAQIAIGVVASLSSTVSAALSLAAMLVVAVVVDPLATLLVIVVLLVLAVALAPIRTRIKLRSRRAAQTQLAFSAAVAELGELGLEMQAFGVRDQFSERISGLIIEESRERGRAMAMSGALPQLYVSMAFLAVLAALVVVTSTGVDQLAELGAVMLVMLRSLSYGQQLQTAAGMMMQSIPSLEELDTTLERYAANPAVSGTVAIDRIGPIEFDNVSFSYKAGTLTLQDVSLRIEPGEIIGVIGPSGAGKSTLAQLLLGLRQPDSGRITVGGVDLADVDRRSWSPRVAFVAQDAELFTGTITENIRFFRDGIDDEKVRAAATAASIATDIDALPDGFDTHLGVRAIRLSGGQRQRLSIARALAGDPELLVLDEPTSALDPGSEGVIRDTLESLRGSVTVVVIAHRMSTVEICDRIAVIDGGRLVALDSPARLASASEFYRDALVASGIDTSA